MSRKLEDQASSMFLAIDHPAVACFDVEKLVDWYCRNLGMRVVFSNGQTPPTMLIGYDGKLGGGAVIEMMPARLKAPNPADGDRFQPGIRHLALRVNDFDRAYAKLKDLGVTFLMEPGEAAGGGRVVSFRDPEGNELQIVERE